jgi:hypothetical protein
MGTLYVEIVQGEWATYGLGMPLVLKVLWTVRRPLALALRLDEKWDECLPFRHLRSRWLLLRVLLAIAWLVLTCPVVLQAGLNPVGLYSNPVEVWMMHIAWTISQHKCVDP